MFRSLGYRNFRLFFIGQFISQAGTWMRRVAQALLILEVTDSGFAVGLLTAVQFLPVLVLGAWAGTLADRIDKRKLLIVVQAASVIPSVGLAVFAFTDHPSVVGIFAFSLIGGVTTALENPARRSFVIEMVPDDLTQNAISLNSAVMMASRIFGPAFAGVLIASVGYGWCFTLDGLSYAAVIAGLVLMRTSELRPAPITARGKGQVRAGFRYVRGIPELWVPLGITAIIGTFAFNFNVVLPLFVRRSLDGSGQDFTVLFAVLSVGSLVGALHSASRSAIALRDLSVFAAGFGVSMVVLAAMPTLLWSLPPAFAVGVFSIGCMTSTSTLVQVRATPMMRGRVVALQSIVVLGSTPIGGPLVGTAGDAFGPRVAVLIGAAACLVAAGWGVAADRRSRAVSLIGEPAGADPSLDVGVQVPRPGPRTAPAIPNSLTE